ncbi:hypothetical protein GCM10008111_30580 [Alishewanella tabrizica]|uniref:Uncharacterized protein n=2 Tax=Alishewanella tabrizica TaxID=671278 RepID=A0ABQ2WSX7_9ALTE|nr:hypothetical protein GCM10008111_30580 [Alishewanella tabrizica]
MDTVLKKTLVKIILTLQDDHHGCKEEAINLAKQALGCEIQHNDIREIINKISEERVDKIVSTLESIKNPV